MDKLAIERRSGASGPILSLRGELDLAGVGQLEEALRGVEEKRPDVVVVDLRQLSFLDSSGLRALLAADARARKAGRRLLLVRAAEMVQRVFEVSLLDRRLAFVDTPEADPRASGS